MPVYRDPETGKSIRSEEPLSDTELEEAFGGGGGGGLAAAGDYLKQRGQEFVGALQGTEQDVKNLVTGQPYGSGFPGGRRPMESVADAAGTFGPPAAIAAAPLSSGAILGGGLAAGAAGRAGGLSQEDAEGLETATNLLGGAAGILKGGFSAASGARGVAKARFEAIKDAAIANKRALDPAKAAQFGQDLLDATESAFTKPAELRAVRPLLEKITNPQGGPITYADLDQAKIGLQAGKGMRFIRGLVTKAMEATLEGTPEGAALRGANAKWGSLVAKPVLRGTTGFIGRGGSAIEALHQAREGRYKTAAGLGAVALLGGMSPGQLAAGVGGAAGGAARGALLGAGMPTVQGLLRESAAPDVPGVPSEAVPTPEPPSVPGGAPETPGAAPQAVAGKYGREIGVAAQLAGLDPQILQLVISQESGGNVNAISHPAPGQVQTPAHGIMQVTPGTFLTVEPQLEHLLGRKVGVDNPFDNLLAGALLWRKYLDQTDGDIGEAARLYHGGNVNARGPHTQQYVADIQRRFAALTGGR